MKADVRRAYNLQRTANVKIQRLREKVTHTCEKPKAVHCVERTGWWEINLEIYL